MDERSARGGAEGFAGWYAEIEPRLRRALVAALGADKGREATAEAMAWAYGHQDRLGDLVHPVAYLYRVGRSRIRRRLTGLLIRPADWSEPWVEPGLAGGLRSLTERQRIAVVLIHGYQWTAPEVAELLGLEATTVRNHLDRGLAKLRSHLEVDPDA